MNKGNTRFTINILVELIAVVALISSIVRRNTTNIIWTAIFCVLFLVLIIWDYKHIKNNKK